MSIQVKSYHFLQKSLGSIIVWPLICGILTVTLWGVLYSKIDEDKKILRANALKDVTLSSRAYAQYLNRAVEQIDQISMNVKYDWESSHGKLRLENLRQRGMFVAPQFAVVAILDKLGRPVTSTAPMEKWQDTTLRGQFYFHKNNNSSAMQIGLPAVIDSSGRLVIQFTRRIEAQDESFDGVVVISIDPSYFLTFYDQQSLGKMGLLALLSSDDQIGTSRIGDTLYSGSGQAFVSELNTSASSGAKFFSGLSTFVDQQSRILGWQELSSYSLKALVGLSEAELLDANRSGWIVSKNYAIVGSLFLLLFAVVATTMATRLALRKYQAREISDTYRLATEGTDDGFYMMNALRDLRGKIIDFQVVDCNARGALFFGFNREELIGVNLSSLNGENYFKVLLNIYSKAMETGFYEDEYELPDESSLNMVWARRRLARSGTGLAVTIQDISAKKESERDLERLANSDGLTGLYNRHWLLNFLPHAISRAKTAQHMLALLFIDLDGFKNINDTQGHEAGDHLLKSVASRLQSVLRPSDNVIRIGGDEFVVILEPVQRESKPARVAERIAEAFSQPFWLGGEKHNIGASIGISLYPRDGDDTDTLLKNADIAMYSVKAAGKGHYNFFKPELYANIKARFAMEQALVQAIELNQFVLHYQPRVNTISGEMISMEALIRWIHPERGLISPIEFIPIAESTGLILALGDMVMEKACSQISDWKNQQLPLVPVSINVSARQFHAGDLQKKLNVCLKKYEIDATLLEVEITESAMMGEDNAIIAELAAIRSLGIKLLVDDFGTGYSSLSQLQRLEMDVLKIDRVFTSELGKSREGEIFFKAIVSMAHALNMGVVAEGVETLEQLGILRTLCCDEIQGYFISRPVTPETMSELMLQRYLMPSVAI
ncbi:bifunctional diguanylate cyclase/phosphodiesterase [Undibacterium parvum]|uniref:EAL domain-containing protein n=2 Tax=Undibacterium TaxID=401469 RepID=A0A6M4AB69_9BURK|nr:EAL domain-containing protein [Undibacterium parvum]AZP12946.1 EAL domain-containing protein [Undibacterium parvum]QJQ07089.1 EAL domain-containing protein [Undibacterium piscinae]